MGEIIFTVSLILIIKFLLNLSRTPTQKFIIMLLISVYIQLFGFRFYIYDWGEPDIYMASLTLLAVFLVLKEKHFFAVVPICCVGEMIHEGFALMFFPIVFALLFFSFWRETNTSRKRKKFVVLSLTLFVTASLFFYFYFISKPLEKYSSSTVIMEIQNLANGELGQINEDNIKYIWFGAETYALPLWENGKPTGEFLCRVYFVICAVLTCLPSLLFILTVWISRIKNYKENDKLFLNLSVSFLFLQ